MYGRASDLPAPSLVWNLWSAARLSRGGADSARSAQWQWTRTYDYDSETQTACSWLLAILAGLVAASVSLAMMASLRETHVLLRPQPNRRGKSPWSRSDFASADMVVKGSVTRKPGDLEVKFCADRFRDHQVPVEYTGVLLPDPVFVKGRASSLMGPWAPTGHSWPTRSSP